eukprot:scaffold10552_cov276-Chaetoceros_neogracile.AAC.35
MMLRNCVGSSSRSFLRQIPNRRALTYSIACRHLIQKDNHRLRLPTNQRFVTSISRGGEQSATIKKEVLNEYKRVYVAVGANIGDRFQNLMTALAMLEGTTIQDVGLASLSSEQLIRLVKTSFLRETEPMYVKDQPSFLNGAVEIETKLSPHALLCRLKDIESQIGRDLNNGKRYGPRPIDLDILYYGVEEEMGGIIVDSASLEVPHPRIQERDFVLSPLCDLNRSVVHPSINLTSREMLLELAGISDESRRHDQEEALPAMKVLPLPRGRMLSFNQTHIMGILNVTPDSFSDGGNYNDSVDLAVQQALQLVEDGASIIDIGGESTRPGAKEVEVQVELERTIPVIAKLREVSDIPISIDTRHAHVAKAAIEAGADIVNDVSGGTFDPNMFDTVAKLKVPIIIMHMRGTPETMESLAQYDDVVTEVSDELVRQSRAAEKAGIPLWLQVLDPGIGFAKDLDHNLSLMKHSAEMRRMVNDIPLLLGPSRKGFIGKITGETIAEGRDFGTLASCMSSLIDENGKLAPTILRVHNVKGIKQGVQIMEAILKAK